VDPVSLDAFFMPVLASDGHTYSADSLAQSMAADPWHRSPVTGEVLRATLYPNLFVAEYLGCEPGRGGDMFTECGSGNIRDLPLDGELRVLSLPVVLDVARARIRCLLDLPADTATTLTLRLRRAHGGLVLMHPPCANNMQEGTLAVAKLFGLDGDVANPRCLATAVIESAPTLPAQTVEAMLVRSLLRQHS